MPMLPILIQLRGNDTTEEMSRAIHLCRKYGLIHSSQHGWLILPPGVGTLVKERLEDALKDPIGDDS